MQGEGCLTWQDGSSFKGQFKNGLPHGEGRHTPKGGAPSPLGERQCKGRQRKGDISLEDRDGGREGQTQQGVVVAGKRESKLAERNK